jgi:hypothetical protein
MDFDIGNGIDFWQCNIQHQRVLKKGKVNDKEVNKIKWHRKLASDTTP